MSNLPAVIDTYGPIIGDAAPNYALITSANHSIGGIIPDVVVEEVHRDEMVITQHPIETGTPVSDHAYMQPVTVQIHCLWSDSSHQAVGYVNMVYQTLQSLQQSAQVFNVSTSKRSYNNMLIRSLYVKNDDKTDFALDVIALCQQVTEVGLQDGGAAQTAGLTSGGNGVTSGGTVSPAAGPVQGPQM